MRHLSYFWRMGPDTAMFQLPFFYTGKWLRGPDAYSMATGAGTPPAPLYPINQNILGNLIGWDYRAWPEPRKPFSLFTSRFGTAGKRPRGVFSYLTDGVGDESAGSFYGNLKVDYTQGSNIPITDWSNKQISQPNLVKADQFVVFNNFGSTPGILPNPTAEDTFAFYTLVFELRLSGAFPDLAKIKSIDFCEAIVDPTGQTGVLTPADIPESLWKPIQVPFGYPLIRQDSSVTLNPDPLLAFERGCFALDDDPRVSQPGLGFPNQIYGFRALLANAFLYPANSFNNIKETAQRIPEGGFNAGDIRVDEMGYLGDLDYTQGIVGMFAPELLPAGLPPPFGTYPRTVTAPGYQPVNPSDPLLGEYGSGEYSLFINEDSGYTKIMQVLSLVRYSLTQGTPQLRIRYYDSFGKSGGGAIQTTYAQTFSGVGPHGPITPPNRYANNLNPLASEGPIFEVVYPNNNEIKLARNFKPNGFVNITVNDTRYYQNPDMTQSLGISGDAAPFPIQPGIAVPQYQLRPNIYILPGQSYDVEYTVNTDMPAFADYLTRVGNVNFGGDPVNVTVRPAFGWDFAQVFFDYWIFEGAEAMICQKLLKLGIDVHPDSVDWYKQMILNMEGLQPDTYERYLILMKEWKQRQQRLDKAYHRKRGTKARNR